jgi:predicted transposase YbfD/YdcC
LDVNFPHAQTVLHVRRRGNTKKTAADWEDAYYLSSQTTESKTPAQWLQTVRDHWAGVEIRNHWRKDACLFEDKTRSRNPNLVGCLILLRNIVLHFFVEHQSTYESLPAFVESVAARSTLALSMIRNSP